MSVSVPRGTRAARLSLRVPSALKDRVRDTVAQLQARGLRTSESELVELLVAEGLKASPDELDIRLRAWRTPTEGDSL
jgi:hypothetical protein